MLSPEAEEVTEGDLGVKSLCLSISNTAIDLNVTFLDDPILTGNIRTCSGTIKFGMKASQILQIFSLENFY